MLFIAVFIPVQISISDVHIIMKISKSQENHIQTISYRNRVFIILYNL